MPDNVVDGGKCTLVPHTFNQVPILEIEYQGRPAFLAGQVGAALGYAEPRKLADNIRATWADEFEEGRDFIKLTGKGLVAFKAAVGGSTHQNGESIDPKTSQLLLLTESGAQLAAILSRTPQGRTFRRWLLDEVLPAWGKRHASTSVGAPVADRARRGATRRELRGPALQTEHAPVETGLALRGPERIQASLGATTPEEEAAWRHHRGLPTALRVGPRVLAIARVLSLIRSGVSPATRADMVAALGTLVGSSLPVVDGAMDPFRVALARAVWRVRRLNQVSLAQADAEIAALALTAPRDDCTAATGTLTGLIANHLMYLPQDVLAEALVAVQRWRDGTLRPLEGPSAAAVAGSR